MIRQIAKSNTFIIVDDEKYLSFSNDEMPQNIGFYTFDKEHASDNVKYPQKVFVWLTLSLKDISTPFVDTRQGSAIIADIYINKYLSQLHSFIEEYHAGDKYRFWPDMASSHYTNETIQWLLSNS